MEIMQIGGVLEIRAYIGGFAQFRIDHVLLTPVYVNIPLLWKYLPYVNNLCPYAHFYASLPFTFLCPPLFQIYAPKPLRITLFIYTLLKYFTKSPLIIQEVMSPEPF